MCPRLIRCVPPLDEAPRSVKSGFNMVCVCKGRDRDSIRDVELSFAIARGDNLLR